MLVPVTASLVPNMSTATCASYRIASGNRRLSEVYSSVPGTRVAPHLPTFPTLIAYLAPYRSWSNRCEGPWGNSISQNRRRLILTNCTQTCWNRLSMRCAMSVRLLPMNARAWFASVLHEVAAWASGCGLCSTLGLTNFARIADTTGVRITTGPICGNSHDRSGKSLWHGRQESTRDETRRYQEHHATRINNV